MFLVKEVNLNEIIDIRHKILRPNQTRDECFYDTDKSEEVFHLGAFDNEKLVSIASFHRENNKDLGFENQFRLRGMATLEDYRKQGAGREIIEYAIKQLKTKGIECLWCNGRTSVIDYYEKLGFEIFGEEFDYPPIGMHIVLYRKI